MTIYVPDELGEKVKADDSLNVSGVCQRALTEELEHRAQLSELTAKGFERIEATADERDIAFYGRLLASFEEHQNADNIEVYLTPKGRIVTLDPNSDSLLIDDEFDGFAARIRPWPWFDGAGNEIEHPLIGQVAQALERKYVVELDL